MLIVDNFFLGMTLSLLQSYYMINHEGLSKLVVLFSPRWLREQKKLNIYVEPRVKAELLAESLYYSFVQTWLDGKLYTLHKNYMLPSFCIHNPQIIVVLIIMLFFVFANFSCFSL